MHYKRHNFFIHKSGIQPIRLARLSFAICIGMLSVSCSIPGSKNAQWAPAPIASQTGKLEPFKLLVDGKPERPAANGEYRWYGPYPGVDYLIILNWQESDRRFYCFDLAGNTYFGTHDFDAFMAKFEKLPKQAAIQEIDSCTASWHREMPESAVKKFRQALGTRTEENEMYYVSSVCRCPLKSVEIVFPEIKN